MEYFLPPPLIPPHDPKALRLSSATGWRLQEKSPEIEIDACGAIALIETGSAAAALDDPAGTLGGLVPPKGVVIDPVYGIIVLDPASRRLRTFDPCTCRFRDVPCGSGDPSDRRHIVKPGGIAIG